MLTLAAEPKRACTSFSCFRPRCSTERPPASTCSRCSRSTRKRSSRRPRPRSTPFPAYIVTDRPEIHIPPGLLKSGTFYVFAVLAQNCSAPEPGRPNRKNLQQTCGFSENRSTQFKTGN